MYSRHISFTLILLLLISGPVTRANSFERIDILAVEYPPFTSKHAPGKGISFKKFQAHVGSTFNQHTYVPVFVPPGRAEKLLANGLYCLSFFPPRSHLEEYKFYALKEPDIELVLVKQAANTPFEWDELSELSGNSVAVLRTEGKGLRHQTMIKSGLKPILVESVKQGLMMLKADRVDFVFGARSTLELVIKENQFDSRLYQISTSYLSRVALGFYYRVGCEEKIFTERATPDY